ncbi:hypothetical protein ACFRH6_01585 [Streptomyces sp. NPDC056749]|uniref:hypothetical protein n=1 Tax=Streptomyces sp. NPDC056749 TaxID=3345936 RepID=UPI0036A8047E
MTVKRRKGLMARFRGWWRGDREQRGTFAPGAPDQGAVWEPPVPAVVEPVLPEALAKLSPGAEPLRLAARGDVFEFHVTPHFRWHSREMPVERLRLLAGVLSAEARDDLLMRSWEVARTCDPADPVEAERLINDRLSEGWCYAEADGLVKCLPTVRVRMDPVLRERIRPARLQEQGMKDELRMGLLKAAHARQLTEEWLHVIAGLEESGELQPAQRQFLVPFAAVLADADFSSAADSLRAARRTGTRALADVLGQAARNHEQVGLFEFAGAYDKALSSFSQQMGLTPFSWILDTAHTPEEAE